MNCSQLIGEVVLAGAAMGSDFAAAAPMNCGRGGGAGIGVGAWGGGAPVARIGGVTAKTGVHAGSGSDFGMEGAAGPGAAFGLCSKTLLTADDFRAATSALSQSSRRERSSIRLRASRARMTSQITIRIGAPTTTNNTRAIESFMATILSGRNGVGFHVSLSCHKVIAASAHDANRKKFRSNQKNQYAASRPQLAVERAVLNGFRDVVAGGFLNGSVLKNDNFDFSCGLYVYKFSCFSLSNFLAGFRLLLIRLTAGVTRV